MQAILWLFLISAFLTAGTALECETCIGVGMTCTGKNMSCKAGSDTCATILTEVTQGGVTGKSIIKTCIPKSDCTARLPNIEIPGGAAVTRIECHNNAPPTAVSFFVSLSGLLLMKMLL